MIVVFVLLCFISKTYSWSLYDQISKYYVVQGIAFTRDDKAIAIGEIDTFHLQYINSSGSTYINTGSNVVEYVKKCIISKSGQDIVYGGDDEVVYKTKYPDFYENLTNSFTVNNDRVYDMDFSYDDKNLVICGDDSIEVYDFTTNAFLKKSSISSGGSSCEYSDVGNKFGWTDGKSFYVNNSNFINFYNNTFSNNVQEIRFLRGNPYPIVLVTGIGIIKTAANKIDWQIINFPVGWSYGAMCISKDEKFIAIGSSVQFDLLIYEVSEFKPYLNYNINNLSFVFYNYYFPTLPGIKEIEFSNSGNNFIVTLSNSKSSPTFWNCTEPCGDSLVYNLDCDLGTGSAYDGCYDNCTVEKDFSCTKDMTTFENYCTYYGPISLKWEKTIKNQPKINEGEIILNISPPLHSFKNLTESQLSSIFALPPKFTALSYSYDEDTGQLNISFSVNEEMENEPFYIDFDPSKIGIDKYFASPNYKLQLTDSDNSKFMPFYFSNDELLSLSLMISYASVFAPIAGWLLFFVGLFSKSLAGLETLMTFQFCGLTLHWLKCRFFMGLRYANSIKYLSGFNIALEEENITTPLETAQTYSLLRTFDIDLNFFANNLNLMLLICVPFLLAVVILRFLVFKEKRKTSTTDHEEDQTKINVLKSHKHFSENSLLYSLFAFYIPFLEYFMLFIETGQYTHVASWIFSLTYLFLLITVMGCFYRNPLHFETFWFSFRIHLIHIHYFYFYVLALTLATVFIIKLPNIPYVSTIPCLLMFVYTIIIHPYSNLKENIRSSLNYLAMCSFLVFNIYVLKIPSIEISTKQVYFYLLINLCVVLPIVFLLALVLSLYYCYKRFHKLKTEQYDLEGNLKDQRILDELSKANLRNKMCKTEEENEYFKKFVIPNESIYDYSNRLINYESNSMSEKENEQSAHEQFCEKGEVIQKKFQKIKNLKKMMMLGLETEIKESDFDQREIFEKVKNFSNINENLDDCDMQEHVEKVKNENEESVINENELVKEVIKNENFFINTKRIVQKVGEDYDEKGSKKEEKAAYLAIYNNIE